MHSPYQRDALNIYKWRKYLIANLHSVMVQNIELHYSKELRMLPLKNSTEATTSRDLNAHTKK